MPLTAWKHSERKKQMYRTEFTETLGGYVIPVGNNSLNDGN